MVFCFEFNPFAENTYIVADEATRECIIFDPGCFTAQERSELWAFIEDRRLKPVRLINTHCHLDHVFGNDWVCKTWNLDLEIHEGEIPVLQSFPMICQMYGVQGADPQPKPKKFIDNGDKIKLGNLELEAILTPGHSPASLSFYCASEGFIIAGDVLFYESIGRTDLPGGDHRRLLESIRTRLFPLPDATIVYPGHGPATTIRHEKEYNPFL